MEKFIGDAVMAVFGALISHGDDAERAVRAGLAVLEAVSQLKLEARGAVNTGEAVVNVQAGRATGEALAMGDVVNTASRLQNSAPSGSLVGGGGGGGGGGGRGGGGGEAAVERLLPATEVEETTRYISLLTGIGVDEPARDRDYLFFAARRLLEGLASIQPLLVIFEDLHWADAALLDLIEYLATHIKDVPLVIVGLTRPEFVDRRPAWGSGLFAHTTIGLEPLSSAESFTLAERLVLKSAGLKGAIERLAEASEGNPLFVEELSSALTEGHELGSDLPTTVRAAIAARLDALPNTARAVLLDASVVGRTFWRGVLSVLRGPRELDEALAALEVRDF